jgi:hypothetical protein
VPFARRMFDGQLDEIQGIFYSLERHLPFTLEYNKVRENRNK